MHDDDLEAPGTDWGPEDDEDESEPFTEPTGRFELGDFDELNDDDLPTEEAALPRPTSPAIAEVAYDSEPPDDPITVNVAWGDRTGELRANASLGEETGEFRPSVSLDEETGEFRPSVSLDEETGAFGAGVSLGEETGAFGADVSLGEETGAFGADVSLGDETGEFGADVSLGDETGDLSLGAPLTEETGEVDLELPLPAPNAAGASDLRVGTIRPATQVPLEPPPGADDLQFRKVPLEARRPRTVAPAPPGPAPEPHRGTARPPRPRVERTSKGPWIVSFAIVSLAISILLCAGALARM